MSAAITYSSSPLPVEDILDELGGDLLLGGGALSSLLRCLERDTVSYIHCESLSGCQKRNYFAKAQSISPHFA